MKSVAYILSFIVFSMSVSPCSDGLQENTTNTSTVRMLNSIDSSHSHKEKDDCNSFCTCDCCGASITVPSVYRFESSVFIQTNYSPTFPYIETYFFTFFHAIWHPPTIA